MTHTEVRGMGSDPHAAKGVKCQRPRNHWEKEVIQPMRLKRKKENERNTKLRWRKGHIVAAI